MKRVWNFKDLTGQRFGRLVVKSWTIKTVSELSTGIVSAIAGIIHLSLLPD